MAEQGKVKMRAEWDEDGKLSVDFIPPKDDGTGVVFNSSPADQVEPINNGFDIDPAQIAKEHKDPTLGMMATEYALYGPSYDGRHVFGEE